MEKILDCLAFGRDEKSYSEEVRAFCLTLHYYHPRAYNYVREKFNNNLPSVSTIRSWYSSINASPGITTEALESLKKKVEEAREKGKSFNCCLMYDEMAIRRHAQWNTSTMRFDGFVDIGRPKADTENLPLAKETLVYLVSGVEDDFKIPIAYFLIDGLLAAEKAALTNEVLIRLGEIEAIVLSITFDGPPSNFAMCKILGADFLDGKAYIPDPVHKNRRIYVLLDPPHMLKLSRNCLGSRNLVDTDNQLIEWKYIQMVYDAQKNLPYNLGNKLTKEHMQWESKKMSVKLAAETLSHKVADSIEFMAEEYDQFRNSMATVKYIRTIKDIFHIMNSTKLEGAIGFKQPITKSNSQTVFKRFDEAMVYLQGLKVEGEAKSIFTSNSQTPFIGFYNNMINFKRIFEEYVNTNEISALVTHRFSQDLLESLFGCIRSMGGFNDNPTAQQFEAAYRKLLIHNDVVCSKKSNCIEKGTKILTVSSQRKPNFKTNHPVIMNEMIFEDEFVDAALYTDDSHSHSLAYMASVLETKIITAKRQIIKCEKCMDVFIENELMQDSFIRFKEKRTNITQPCKSTFDIIKFVDSYLTFCKDKSYSFDATVLQILGNIPFETLFSSSDFEKHPEKGHKYEFVKRIVQSYMSMKSIHVAKCFTLKSHDEPIRHKYKKLIQQKGQ